MRERERNTHARTHTDGERHAHTHTIHTHLHTRKHTHTHTHTHTQRSHAPLHFHFRSAPRDKYLHSMAPTTPLTMLVTTLLMLVTALSVGHASGTTHVAVGCHSHGISSLDVDTQASLTLASFNVEWLFDGVADHLGAVAGRYNPHAGEGEAGATRRARGVAEVLTPKP